MTVNIKKIPSILIVDDSPSDIYLAEHYIEEAGICDNIYVCNDGQEAFDFLVECKERVVNFDGSDYNFPTMILLDINMPRLGGFGLLEKIKQAKLYGASGNPQNIVMLTTSDFEGDSQRSSDYTEVSGYITKPLLSTHASILLELHQQRSAQTAAHMSN